MTVLHKGTTSSNPDISQLYSKELGINVLTGEIYLKAWDVTDEKFVLMRHRPLNSFVGLTYIDGELSVNLNNTLTSNSTTEALTAAQGKILNDKITEIRTLNTLNTSGKILQVVSKVITTQASQTIGPTDTQLGVGTDYELTITPIGANSKIKIEYRHFGESDHPESLVLNVLRNTVRVNAPSNDSWAGLTMTSSSNISGGWFTNNESTPEVAFLTTIDETPTVIGTPITYRIVASSSVNTTLWTNRCSNPPSAGNEIGTSEIILTEIGA